MTLDIESVLRDYLADIVTVVGIMKAEGHKRNSTQAWQQTLYQAGTIPAAGLNYHFHGIGCYVEWKNKIIDFDFRGDEECTIFGIDRWFAAKYLQSLKLDGYDDVDLCHDKILEVLKRLTNQGKMVKHDNVYFYLDDYKKII